MKCIPEPSSGEGEALNPTFVRQPPPPLDRVSPQNVDFLALPVCDVQVSRAHTPSGVLREARGQEARSTCRV